jgi:hypothetical protein
LVAALVHFDALTLGVNPGSLGAAVPPRNGGLMYTYRLHLTDGSDAGQATYAVLVRPGEEILVGNGRRFRVLDVVPFEEEDESPLVGLLKVEALQALTPRPPFLDNQAQ